jgi:hypothetical protein
MPSVDDFSTIARENAQYRPIYPAELFRSLASISPARALALDCAMGNGQAARGLADFFERVLAVLAYSIPECEYSGCQILPGVEPDRTFF